MVIIRPPSEADSLLLPVMMGCSRNTCTFCGTYQGIKFRIRPFADVKADIDHIASHYSRSVSRIFLENGDAMVLAQSSLVQILKYLKESFPNLERVGSYGNAPSLLRKSLQQLRELKGLGLSIIYLGVESGDDGVLKRINKGVDHARMVEAGKRVREAGIALSVSIILGMGGLEASERHALATGRILTELDPEFASALTLTIRENTPLYKEWQEGEFHPVSIFQYLQELKIILETAKLTNCFFTSNHASNYLALRLKLPGEKEAGIKLIDEVLAGKHRNLLRPEHLRAL